MIKFRVWDGDTFWYSNKQLKFSCYHTANMVVGLYFGMKDLEQYTCFKDIKGKLIYVNDYVRVNGCDEDVQVVFEDGIFGVVTKSVYAGGGHVFSALYSWETLEVTGNIHKNK